MLLSLLFCDNNRANCDHIAALPPIDDSKLINMISTQTAEQVRRFGRELINNFLYNQAGKPTNTITSTNSSFASKDQNYNTPESLFPSALDLFSSNSTKHEQFINRCAFNLHTGTKKGTAITHMIDSNGIETRHDSHCSRSEFRFSLIDVLSGLHDDGALYNRRYNMPTLATELYLRDYSKNTNHKCFK